MPTPLQKRSPMLIDDKHYGYDITTIHRMEQAVLGALILEREAMQEVSALLQPKDFEVKAHQSIYSAIQTLYNAKDAIDIYTLARILKKEGTFEQVGGAAYLAELTHYIASAEHIQDHAKAIMEASLRRKLKRNALALANKVNDYSNDALHLLHSFDLAIKEIHQNLPTCNEHFISEVFADMIQERSHPPQAIPTGYTALDALIDPRYKKGWLPSELTILAARPGQGKTSLMLNWAINALRYTQDEKDVVLFFSLEMSKNALGRRIASILSDQSDSSLTDTQLLDATADFANKKLIINDASLLTPFDIYARVRKLKNEYNLKVIFIDYLQILSPGESKPFYNREQEVASIVRFLKALAKDLALPVIVGSQMNRQHESRGGGGARLSDLRESDAIGNEADNVFFIQEPYESQNHPAGYVELHYVKHRNGPTGMVPLIFDRPTQRLRGLD